VSDEGSAFDIGRRAVRAVTLAEEHRGPATELSERVFALHQCRGWDPLAEQIAKNPDDVFPRTFPLVAELADKGDAVSREIMMRAAASLAELASSAADALGWCARNFWTPRLMRS
jgi:N-acetylglucosamine kinase-like BadF-type ATPase